MRRLVGGFLKVFVEEISDPDVLDHLVAGVLESEMYFYKTGTLLSCEVKFT